MNFDSIPDLLYFAISKEQASRQFYLELAEQTKDIVTRQIFEVIAAQEQKHEEALKLEVLKQGYTLSDDEPQSPSAPSYSWQKQLDLEYDAVSMNYTDALMVAIQKERASFQLYTQLISLIQAPEFRQVLLELAEEEMRHVIQFEREYDAVSH